LGVETRSRSIHPVIAVVRARAAGFQLLLYSHMQGLNCGSVFLEACKKERRKENIAAVAKKKERRKTPKTRHFTS
jgi:hypothetical protein